MARKQSAKEKRARTAHKKAGATKEQKQAAASVIKAEVAASKLESKVKAGTATFADLSEKRTDAMEERAKRFVGRDKITDKPKKGAQTLEKTIDEANKARAYADAMRRITKREKGVGTPYTGGGLLLEDGDLDEGAFQEFRDVRFMGDTTPAQRANIQEMMKQPGATVRDRRATWREEVWGDEWNEKTGMWEKGDRTKVLELQKKWQKNPPTLEELFKGDYGDTGDNLLDTGGRKGRGWQVGGPGGPAGETDYLAYRPGSEAYWRSYMGPKLTGSLMRMKQPAVTQASLGYLPGEIRDPTSWRSFLGYDGKLDKQFQGAIPQGTWRTGLAKYPGLGQAGIRQPGWQFAAAPSQMIAQPAWTAYDISPQAAGEWTGLLGDWAAPALNTTNLLGVA